MNIREIFFLFLVLTGFILSMLNNFYQIEHFDNFRIDPNTVMVHSMITSDILNFWKEGAMIAEDLTNGKSYLENGEEYRRPYLPSRIYAFFSILLSQDLVSKDGAVSLEFNKISILITQTSIYYILLIGLYFVLKNHIPKNISKVAILFLAFEPTLFMYHSSFWSESFFFSLQILLLILILFKNQNTFSFILIGIVLGLLYLQRSFAVLYVLPILIYLYFQFKKQFLNSTFTILLILSIVHFFVGYHNYKRIGVFYSLSTQAKDGFYDYFIPGVMAKKQKISVNEAQNLIKEDNKVWMKENNLDELSFKDEKKRLKYYDYAQNYAFDLMFQNPIITLNLLIKNTIHFMIIDPLTHVYFFHSWNNENGLFYNSEIRKKMLLPRIFYSLFIYLFVIYGFYKFFKKERNNKLFLLIILSIMYFFLVQSWYGGTRYYAPVLIYLSLPFAYGFVIFKDQIKKKLNN